MGEGRTRFQLDVGCGAASYSTIATGAIESMRAVQNELREAAREQSGHRNFQDLIGLEAGDGGDECGADIHLADTTTEGKREDHDGRGWGRRQGSHSWWVGRW